jgi:Family of unknown function (DUF6232)
VGNEANYYSQGSVQVTSARFVVGSQTYAMRNVTSVKGITIWPGRIGPIAFALLGIALIITLKPVAVVFGLCLVVSCSLLLYYRKPTHAVVLTTAGGEIRAYESSNAAKIGRILDALNQAIVEMSGK